MLLFDSGKATVKDEFQPIGEAIAKALEPEPGPINVIGHTDNVKPSTTARFKSNFDLSVARAQGVATLLEPLVSDKTRLAVDGRGDLEPIADNGTTEGRAQNRRVEISIPREETLNRIAASMKKWLVLALVIVGLLAFAAIIWFAGPFLGFGDFFPLEGWEPRLLIILIVCGGIGLIYLIRFLLRRRAAKKLEKGLLESGDGGSDAKLLNDRMAEAIATLKQSSGKSNYLYTLPWYIIIGPPGAGKTTALLKSGLKFPLLGPDGGAAIAGTGGTRYCDWWFTDEAVLIDTAGRYTTQDFGRQGRQEQLAQLPPAPQAQPSQAADQRRHRRDQPRRRDEAHKERARGAFGGDPQAPDRGAPGAQDRFPGLCALHQGRPRRPASTSTSATSPSSGGARSGARRSRPRTAART